MKKQDEVTKKGHIEGYRRGYSEAESLYKVTYPCSVCGEALTVTTKGEKEALKEYMQEYGWGHQTCHKRGR